MLKQKPFFYRDSVKRTLWIILIICCVFSNIFDLFLDRHSHFSDTGIESIDGILGFYSLLGFFGCVLLILVAKFFGVFLKKSDKYYE